MVMGTSALILALRPRRDSNSRNQFVVGDHQVVAGIPPRWVSSQRGPTTHGSGDWVVSDHESPSSSDAPPWADPSS